MVQQALSNSFKTNYGYNTPTSGQYSAQQDPNRFYSYTEPYGAQLPGAYRAAIGGASRSGVQAGNMGSLSSLARNLYNPNLNARGTSLPSWFTSAMQQKQNLGMNDFGIPADIQEKMKVAAATPLNAQADAQKEASKRLLAKQGLLNDSAMFNANEDIEQNRNAEVSKAYNDIGIQSGLKANEQRLANLNELANFGLQGAQFTEAGRQFNVGAELDKARLSRATEQWLEQAGMNRTQLNESIAEFLENYDLERLKIAQGLVGTAPETAKTRIAALSSATNDASGIGFGGFSSGGFGG